MSETRALPETTPPPDLELQSNPVAQKVGSQVSCTSVSGYWRQLVHHGYKVQRDDVALPEFATLQRLNLIHIQNKLAEFKADIADHRTTSETQMDQLRRILHEYTTAIQDFDYMSKLRKIREPTMTLDTRMGLEDAFPTIAKREGAPYDTNYLTLRCEVIRSADAVREFLRKYLFRRLAWSTAERDANPIRYNRRRPPQIYSNFVDGLARFIVAVGGGCSLIIPMLVMSFNPSRDKSLITVSVAVVLFALSISLAFQTDNKDTLTATATYAAVLVVFVGTSATGSSSVASAGSP